MPPTSPALDSAVLVVAMARDLEVRLAGLLAADRAAGLAPLRDLLAELLRNLAAQAEGRGAGRAVPVGAMVARLGAAVRDLGDEAADAPLSLAQRGAAWRLGAELVRLARELPQVPAS